MTKIVNNKKTRNQKKTRKTRKINRNRKITKKIHTHKVGGNLRGLIGKAATRVREGVKFLGRKAGVFKSSDETTDKMLLVFFDRFFMPYLYKFFQSDDDIKDKLLLHYPTYAQHGQSQSQVTPNYDDSFVQFIHQLINLKPNNQNQNHNLLKINFMKNYLSKLYGNNDDDRTNLKKLCRDFNSSTDYRLSSFKEIDLNTDTGLNYFNNLSNDNSKVPIIDDARNIIFYDFTSENKIPVLEFFKNFNIVTAYAVSGPLNNPEYETVVNEEPLYATAEEVIPNPKVGMQPNKDNLIGIYHTSKQTTVQAKGAYERLSETGEEKLGRGNDPIPEHPTNIHHPTVNPSELYTPMNPMHNQTPNGNEDNNGPPLPPIPNSLPKPRLPRTQAQAAETVLIPNWVSYGTTETTQAVPHVSNENEYNEIKHLIPVEEAPTQSQETPLFKHTPRPRTRLSQNKATAQAPAVSKAFNPELLNQITNSTEKAKILREIWETRNASATKGGMKKTKKNKMKSIKMKKITKHKSRK